MELDDLILELLGEVRLLRHPDTLSVVAMTTVKVSVRSG
jgi:hypothetical protein